MVRSAVLLVELQPDAPDLLESVPDLEALLDAARADDELVEQGILYPRIARRHFDAGDVIRGAEWTLGGLGFADRFGAWYASGFCVANLVRLASDRGDDGVAARLHGSLAPIMAEVVVGLSPGPAAVYRSAVEAVRERLGAVAFDRRVTDGALLQPAEALAVAVEYTRDLGATEPAVPAIAPAGRRQPSVGVNDGPSALTPRELDILRVLVTGATNRQIGDQLGLRPKTVMHHSVSIYGKLGVRGRTEATAWAYRQGLLE